MRDTIRKRVYRGFISDSSGVSGRPRYTLFLWHSGGTGRHKSKGTDKNVMVETLTDSLFRCRGLAQISEYVEFKSLPVPSREQ